MRAAAAITAPSPHVLKAKIEKPDDVSNGMSSLQIKQKSQSKNETIIFIEFDRHKYPLRMIATILEVCRWRDGDFVDFRPSRIRIQLPLPSDT
ncbi:hypothetical protein BVIET440_50138 [Burkholderia vietnamiensis]